MRTIRSIAVGTCALATAGLLIAENSDVAVKQQAAGSATKTSVDDEKPKLGEESVKRVWSKNVAAWKTVEKHSSADNSLCLDCHVDHEEEKLTAKHVDHGVGCKTCHGASQKHLDDEDSLTAPDIMFVKEAIITFCMECHTREQLSVKKQHVQLFEKRGVLKNKTCIDCHGKRHRIRRRMVNWDKKTGKLIEDAKDAADE